MKIKLIAPSNKKACGSAFWEMGTFAKLVNRKYSQISLALPTIAALTPSDIDVVITDENIEEIDFDKKTDLVGITTNTYTANRAYEIADIFRKRDVKVVLGGMHVSVLPDEAGQHSDAVVIGEAEGVWNELISDFKNKNLKRIYQSDTRPDLKNSPVPRWDLVKTDQYLYHTIQTTRGCPFNCDFCSVKLFFGKEYRYKPIENVLKEIELLIKIEDKKVFFFSDDNIIANKRYTKELFEALIPYKIHWLGQAAVNIGFDSELLELMHKSGCRQILMGFESLSEENLRQINKPQINKIEEYVKIIETIHSHCISIIGAFIVGGDFDDESVFEKIKCFVEKNNIAFPHIGILTPLPGTRLYKRLKEEDRLINKEWSNYDLSKVCFKPRLMSPEVLQKGYVELVKGLYSYESIIKRFNRLWEMGVLAKRGKHRRLFTRNGFFLFLKCFFTQDFDANRILLTGLLDKREPFVSSLLGLVRFHNYAKNLKMEN